MTPAKRISTTKKEIIQVASRMFLEKGFTETSVKSICDQLNISTGNLTFHFPTKEHLLSVLVGMLCDFQWEMMEHVLDEGNSSMMAGCLEILAMASICEENEVGRDFYLSAYTHPMTLEIIRHNDMIRSKGLFAPFCPDWTDEDYSVAEQLVSGIEYATLMNTSSSVQLKKRVCSALEAIMNIYKVPVEIQQKYIQQVAAVDAHALGEDVLHKFIQYVHDISEEDLEKLLIKQSEGMKS